MKRVGKIYRLTEVPTGRTMLRPVRCLQRFRDCGPEDEGRHRPRRKGLAARRSIDGTARTDLHGATPVDFALFVVAEPLASCIRDLGEITFYRPGQG
ncbi:hypothetical protein ACFCYH_15700 [Streptomyces sp. NPDC056400]|uniref:hypothetical protein n=1 Tax=Streptomyces sp. NPDC056400 TaxID=3345808 RepID=UPI0035D995EC